MRDSINGAWFLGIMLVFMSVFIAYIAISINYNNAFRIKTNIVTTIEQYEGINSSSLARIKSFMSEGNYNAQYVCQTFDNKQSMGVNGDIPVMNPSGKYNYCVYREHRGGKGASGRDSYYYTVEVFLDFRLPILNNLFDFRIEGETNAINYPNDGYFTN